jgi:hypothetical protein
MAIIKVNASQGLSGALPAISGANLTGISAGKVLQVKQTLKTDTFTTTSQSFVDVTGLNVSITPSSSSNKILVIVDLQVGSDNDSQAMFNLLRDSTSINVGDASGSRIQCFAEQGSGEDYHQQSTSTHFLDSPSTTSATNYKVQMRVTGGTHCLNRGDADANASYEARTTSTITVYEIEV